MCNVQKRYVTLNIHIKSKYYNKYCGTFANVTIITTELIDF